MLVLFDWRVEANRAQGSVSSDQHSNITAYLMGHTIGMS